MMALDMWKSKWLILSDLIFIYIYRLQIKYGISPYFLFIQLQ